MIDSYPTKDAAADMNELERLIKEEDFEGAAGQERKILYRAVKCFASGYMPAASARAVAKLETMTFPRW